MARTSELPVVAPWVIEEISWKFSNWQLPADGDPLQNPLILLLLNQSARSRDLTRRRLEIIMEVLECPETNPFTYPWWEMDYLDMLRLQSKLFQQQSRRYTETIMEVPRSLLKMCWRLGLMEGEAFRRAISLDRPRRIAKVHRSLVTDEELAALFHDCAGDSTNRGIRDAAIIAVLRTTGIRRAELSNLVFERYDQLLGEFEVWGKFQLRRTVYMTGLAKEAVDRWIQIRGSMPGPFFYPIYNDGLKRARRMGHYTVHKMLHTRSRRAGIPHITPHDLRRTFISRLLLDGIDPLTVQTMAGHKSLQSTQIYDLRGEVAKKQAAQRIALPASVLL